MMQCVHVMAMLRGKRQRVCETLVNEILNVHITYINDLVPLITKVAKQVMSHHFIAQLHNL